MSKEKAKSQKKAKFAEKPINEEKSMSGEKSMSDEKSKSGEKPMSKEKTIFGKKPMSKEKTISGKKPMPGKKAISGEKMSEKNSKSREKAMSKEKTISGEKSMSEETEKVTEEKSSEEIITEENVIEPLIVKEAFSFREMMEAIPFVGNEPKRLRPLYNTLLLFVSKNKEVKKDIYRIEKAKEELSIIAEQNVNWVLSQFLPKFEGRGLLYLIVRLSCKRWKPIKSEFQTNNIIRIANIPALAWFDEPYPLEGHKATDLMLIKNLFYFKLKQIKFLESLKPVEEIPEEPTEIEFEKYPQFKFLDYKSMRKAEAEAAKRVKQVKKGKCQYDAMIDAFTILSPKERKQFLKELEAAEPDVWPFGGTYERREDVERPIIELELDKPNVKKEIYEIERYLTPKQVEEEKELLEKKTKKTPKKTKGKKRKGKGKGVKGKGKGGIAKGKKGIAKGKGGKKGGKPGLAKKK